MNIQTVAENLRNTIKGKEELLASMTKPESNVAVDGWSILHNMLTININELKSILSDVEKCVAKEVEQSWRDNPDRMGGQYTQEEIDRSDRWV